MAASITITIPPNTTVHLPSSDTLQKMVSDNLTISLDNQSGETISLESSGSGSSFSVDELPATIADSVSNDIVLSVVQAGDIDFDFGEDSETIAIEIQSAGSAGAGAMMLLGVG